MSHVRDSSPKPYGVVAEFDTPEKLLDAAKEVRAAGYRDMDAYSPFPVHGLTDVMEFKDDRLGIIVLVHGFMGLGLGYLLQWWTSVDPMNSNLPVALDSWLRNTGLMGYAHNVGGKPLNSYPAFFPPAYELTILLAAFGATFGMLALNGFPKPHHPVNNAECMTRTSSDRFALCVEATDPRYDEDKVVDLMRELGPLSVERVMTSEGY